jgi:hypothetical protein
VYFRDPDGSSLELIAMHEQSELIASRSEEALNLLASWTATPDGGQQPALCATTPCRAAGAERLHRARA